ncbi:MAG: UPF0149 family protein [Gammaproteobacteria bacterium]|nr:UPF0149 family protein [Gammaproteobacteria bacterium]
MDWSRVNAALRRLGVATDAAEGHGVLCGLLCARGPSTEGAWLDLVRSEQTAGAVGSADAEAWEELSRLYRATLGQLRDEGFAFALLLPEDDQPLLLRAEAMTEWCQGFLYGFAAGGVEDTQTLPEEVREVVEDIVEISHASADGDEGEPGETAYAELIEYLRVGVILVFETLEAERAGAAADRVIH